MADLVLEGPDYLPSLEAARDFTQVSRFDDIEDNLLSTTVPEPVCVRGVGGRTL